MTEYREFLDPNDRQRVEDMLSGPWIEVWPRVQEAWMHSDAVYIGIVGPAISARVRVEYALALELPIRFPEALQALRAALFDGSPTVVAYSLLALMESPSWNRGQLDDSIFERPEMLRWHCGCQGWDQALGSQIRELVAGPSPAGDPWEAAKEAERRWAGRLRPCPVCGTRFASVQDLGVCPHCRHTFRASRSSAG